MTAAIDCIFFRKRPAIALAMVGLFASMPSLARAANPEQCGDMEYWDAETAMCLPMAMADMPMQMLMVHGNAFVTGVTEEGPRGRSAVAAPDMLMVDAGRSLGDRNYLNLELMATAEKWLFPSQGYPELLQQGEFNSNGQPFIDAQHPHSSPVMGLALSDTYSLGNSSDHLRLSFAPRGSSTDGPIAFMHRETGEVNPDVPLGHHIGQDVGHISSTVVAAQLTLDKSIFEVSAFHGEEPSPESVDLPIGALDSYSFRYTRLITDQVFAMASFAFVNNPEGDATIPHDLRYSVSAYDHHELDLFGQKVLFQNSTIFGAITQYDHAQALYSFGEEFLFDRLSSRFWGRFEVLERTPAELAISNTLPNTGQWIEAITLGYTHEIWSIFSAGISGTKDFLPSDYQSTYGGNPWSGKVFVQISGMSMWM